MGEALYPLAAIRPATAAFWQAFCAHGGGTDDPGAFLERSVRMMAARMMVTAFEISLRAEELDPRVVSIIRCALEILERPAAAARDLLGIDPDGLAGRVSDKPVLAACA